MNLPRKVVWTLYVLLLIPQSIIYATSPSEGTVHLYTPFPHPDGILDATLDAAGYSDAINWGRSGYHPHNFHELLSGEWAAAIYYNGIATEPNAMWLTNRFVAPTWTTNSKFQFETWPEDWNDPNNPVIGIDTGRSVIENNEVEVTIDYEIADLGEGNFSPLVYHEPNSVVYGVKSERYVLLQTYTIKNKKAGNLTGLEFYQMLHGHGADDYGPVVHCSLEVFFS